MNPLRTKARILWAEDDERQFQSLSESLRVSLKSNGIELEIDHVVHGDRVYKELLVAAADKYDILLVDLEMDASWNGINTIKDLVNNNKSLPIIVLSGHVYDDKYAKSLTHLINNKSIYGFYHVDKHEEWCDAVVRLLKGTATVLHISDIHFGSSFAFKSSPGSFEDRLLALCGILKQYKVDIVIASGDFTTRGEDQGFAGAMKFLRFISDHVEVPIDHFVLVPGNHDVHREDTENRRMNKYIEFVNTFYSVPRQSKSTLRNYLTLFDKTKRQLRAWSALSGDPFFVDDLCSVSVFDEIRTIVIGLNSVVIEDTRLGEAEVSQRQLGYVTDYMSTLPPSKSSYFRVAVFHHSPFSVPNNSHDGFHHRVIRNQSFLLQQLSLLNVRLALHGDMHYALGHRYQPILIHEHTFSPALYIFGAGTFGSNEHTDPQSFLHFNILRYSINPGETSPVGQIIPVVLPSDRLRWQIRTPIDLAF